jgi:hypothetical protein
MSDSVVHLSGVDLATDPRAQPYVKDETVEVEFAAQAGELASLEGPNRYQAGDALVRAATGERWVVSRERFVPKYVAVAPLIFGESGAYKNIPSPVRALRMEHAFTIARSAGGDVLKGDAGDWLLQYAPGDYGVVQRERFARVYRLHVLA